eukprot:g25829.t1
MPSSFFPKGLLRRRAVTVPTSFSGREMMKRMPKSKNPKELEANCAPVTPLTRSFRKLRTKLEEEGWWKRDLVLEGRQWFIWASVTALGVVCARSGHWLALLGVVLLALANTQEHRLARLYDCPSWERRRGHRVSTGPAA